MSSSGVTNIRGTPNNLPVLRSSLIGRAREAAAARDLLLRDEVGLLTLTGTGGVGKTRLALQLAADFLPHFPDGVYFVDLAPITDPSLVVPTIAQTLDLRESEARPLMESLKEYLRPRELLLLLDNFEQVLEAGPYVADLLATCPRLKVLVTSRELLHLYEEHNFPVPPLDLPDPRRLSVLRPPPLEQLIEYDAVRLFSRRALVVKPDFAIDATNAVAMAEICVRLDGLPLAIELAAARVQHFLPQEMLVRLEEHLPLLTAGAHDRPARQQTMRATIDWSYQLLDDVEKTLFRRFSVFAGGCTLEAVQAVCDPADVSSSDTEKSAASLEDKSLLRQDQHDLSGPRLLMLETVREYAAERLHETGEGYLLARRHAQYYLELAELGAPQLQGPEQGVWLARLGADYANLRTALRWSLAESATDAERIERVEMGARLVRALYWYWYMRSYLTEGREWCERLLARSSGSDRARAAALFGSGVMTTHQGDPGVARPRLEEAAVILRQLGDRKALSLTLFNLGVAALNQGDDTAALAAMQDSAVLFLETGNRALYPVTLLHLGDLALRRRDYPAARSFYEQFLANGRKMGNRWFTAQALNNLGEVARCEGDYARAASLYDESLQLFRELENSGDIARSLHNLAYIAHHMGEDARAAGLFHESLERFQERGNKRGMAECLAGLATVALGFAGAGGRGTEPQAETAHLGPAVQRSALLLAAAQAEFDALGVAMWPADQVEYDRNLAALRTLGSALNSESFEQAWAEGHGMSLETAVAYALADTPLAAGLPGDSTPGDEPTASIHVPTPAYPAGLTRREAEVLRLVAAGLSNAELADRLSVSINTVESHLRAIYGKIGVTRRSAATRFALEHNLV
jgi:predicted ATPase/DNA-binding CsgD family transcriptional regulator